MNAATPIAESIWSEYRNTKSRQLRDRLLRQNDKLALKIAHRMSGECAEPIEDLAQIARIGLVKAIERFDPEQCVAFSSFAVPYIRGEIQHFLRDHWHLLKVPRRAFETVGKVRKVQRQLDSMGRAVSAEQVAAAMGIDTVKWQWISEAVQRKALVELEDSLHLAEEDDAEAVSRLALHKEILRKVALLPKLKRQCLIERYFSQLSEETIARKHKLTVPQIQQLLNEAIADLQAQFEEIAR